MSRNLFNASKIAGESRMKTVMVLLIWFAVLASAFAADKRLNAKAAEEIRRSRLVGEARVKRGTLPVIELERSSTASAEEVAQIKKHIANLANIERPDFGLSGTMGGMAFAPVPGSGRSAGGFLLTDHQLKTSDDVRELVALGPRALPFLLDSLTDSTPTNLKLGKDNAFFTVMKLATELDSNPTNSTEQKAVASLLKTEWNGTSLRDYTVKVGDVCFVIIGQIVGRAYLAVRYQPSAIIIVNSPVEKPELAKAVRDIWSSPNAAQRLLSSLLFDYATEGVFNGRSLDGWSVASDLQCRAVLRLLHYFPQEASPMIAERLAQLDVRAGTDFILREVANGVRVGDFIQAVTWCELPVIRQEVFNVLKRTTDTRLLLAALPGIEAKGSELARKRLTEMVEQLPADEPGPYGRGYDLLVALGQRLGAEAKPVFIKYLHDASLQRWHSMSRVLRATQTEWARELLSPALKDARETQDS